MSKIKLLSDLLAEDEEVQQDTSSLSAIFEEEPVDLLTFLQDKKFLGLGKNFVPSEIQATAVSAIERIYYADLYPRMAEELDFGEYWGQEIPMRNLFTFQWGKGSGKDLVSRLGSLRVAYLLLCLKNPQEYFGLPDVDSIHLLNVASNAPQALRAFFNPMKLAVKRGWFKDKAHPTQNSIQYSKNIEAISGHSDAEGQEGLNILFGVLDEIDAFKARDELVGTGNRAREASTTAEGLLEMVKSSAASRFPQTYKRVAISYPRYLGSTIQKLTTEGRDSNEKYGEKSIHYVSGPFATWDVNPRISGREDFQEEYDEDPDKAAAKYECKPKRATNPFFRNFDVLRGAVTSEVMPIEVDYQLGRHFSKHYHREIEAWEPIFTFLPSFQPIQGANYAIHADLAIKGDRAGISMSHVEKWEEYEEKLTDSEGVVYTRTQVRPIVRNDFTFGFEAALDAKKPDGTSLPREIQIRWVRQLVDILQKRGFHIARFTADSFQSQDTLQILEWEGIPSDKMSTDRDPTIYASIKDLASDDRLRMPFDQLLMNELEALTKLDNGKIDHPPSGSKDLSDAFACSVVSAIAVGGEEDPDGAIVSSSEAYFESGQALSPLEGSNIVFEAVGNPMSLPIGFEHGAGNGW